MHAKEVINKLGLWFTIYAVHQPVGTWGKMESIKILKTEQISVALSR